MSAVIHKFAVGGLWEYAGWELRQNHVFIPEDDLCEHVEALPPMEFPRADGSIYYQKQARIPFAIVGWNEGKYNSTGICLHCCLAQTKEFVMTEAALTVASQLEYWDEAAKHCRHFATYSLLGINVFESRNGEPAELYRADGKVCVACHEVVAQHGRADENMEDGNDPEKLKSEWARMLEYFLLKEFKPHFIGFVRRKSV